MAPKYAIEESTYRTVAYADVFEMPIELERCIDLHLDSPASPSQIWDAVATLTAAGRIEMHDNLLCLGGRSKVVRKWHDRRGRVDRMWHDAERWGKALGRVPFVRMVAVTGGLTVDAVGDHDRINYFIVTRPRRLWLTRRLIQLVVKAAKQEGVTISSNHLVTMRALEMPEQSTFMARELAQMTVIVGDELCQSVRRSNAWMFDLVPNATAEGNRTHLSSYSSTRVQRLVEHVLLTRPFRIVESIERRRSIAGLKHVANQVGLDAENDQTFFSSDVCREQLPTRAARVEAALARRLREFTPAAGRRTSETQ